MKGRIKGLTTLNHTLLRGIPSCRRVFGGRAHFSAYLLLLEFFKNLFYLEPLPGPSLRWGGGSRLG